MSKKNKKPKCYKTVRAYVLNKVHGSITVEGVAEQLGLSQGEVQHCFHFLNLEGMLSQAIHRGHKGPSRYDICNKERDKLCRCCWVSPRVEVYEEGEWQHHWYCRDCKEKADAANDQLYTHLNEIEW